MRISDKKTGTARNFRSLRQSSDPLRIVIAGGGTGGHLFPGIAMAQEFMAGNPNNRLLFVGTGKPFETTALSKAGFARKRITSEGIKGRGLWNQTKSILKIPKGIFESVMILRQFRPDLVIGVGGYSAGPLVAGAWLLGIKIVLHEQNILPGITNRILSRLADRIYVSFDDTQTGLNPKKVLYTGNPVRKEILQLAKNQKGFEIDDSKQKQHFTILILGGSQGAHSINMALLETMDKIKEKDKFFFIHQTGLNDETRVRNAYELYGMSCIVQAFFNDMARQYQKADLVICRAGATTVAEIKAIGKSVIFIPFSFAADNHQVLNARSMEKAGAAEIILEEDLNAISLFERINFYASSPDSLHKMASRAKDLGRPDAAETIVDDCYKLVRSAHNWDNEMME
ncbi:MAG: undecaprenyldiphospho-muramoylpentapeptide beta-N-acetylglucosaminyltransferase [Deltaproteobacteria bacterium]|nr:undecaprenyldiphospho-muramoylpentapeptide beta-N-acetylglucosaminyltransferase [Deltaproteobacteria bacterium]MBW2620167.1 undecaprenyldiphospho-muramoylpentapeptide beta-N-acetylglucosaminyltransferase [Deltaproteobacteria bacterium]